MNENKVLMIDIEPKCRNSTESKSEQPLWTRSDNSFKFNFIQDQDICTGDNQAPSNSNKAEHTTGQLAFTGQGSAFAFNFQIDPEEDMDTTETSGATSANKQQCTEPADPLLQQSGSPSDTAAASKSKKKKKKSGKNKAEGDKQKEPKELPSDEQESERAELSTEEQLQRQLDWCIEQLEQGMRSHKATAKQKEDASRALKTLRSSKAPLVKKRQVMRAMAGDYRKKMEEEKSKQLKLIQNETAAAQLRAVSDFPQKSVFHRKAGIKATTSESDTNTNNLEATAAPEKNFVFTPSKEEFRFNFL